MDSLELFEQLDELVREAKTVPLTDQVRLDRGEVGRDVQISRTAERQAEETLSRARKRAFEIQQEVEQWADGVLAMLEPNLENLRRAVRNGRERLLERSSNESAARSM